MEIDKIPYHLDAERAILASMLINNESIAYATENLVTGDFYDARHQVIFEVMANLHKKNAPVDLMVIINELRDNEKLESAGGEEFIIEVSQAVASGYNFEYYVKIISDKAILRKLIDECKVIIDQARDPELTVDTIIENSEKKIFEVSTSRETSSFKNIENLSHEVLDKLENLKNGDSQVVGLTTGFIDLNDMTKGFHPGDMIILAARPSMGKTAFALNLARNQCVTHAKGAVAIFSLEMGADQLYTRVLSSIANVDLQKLRTGSFDSTDWALLNEGIERIKQSKLYIDDTPGITLADMKSKCRRLKKDKGLDVIYIDYLQLIKSSPGQSSDNRQQEVSEISRQLKELARELEVPVIALSQLSRGVEARVDKRPMLSDIRESGSIEQDADVIMFLYREDYYEKDKPQTGETEVIIGKQRNGPVGTVKLIFQNKINNFVDRSSIPE